MHYFRSIHGAPMDAKWLVVARKAKVLPVHVAAVWWSLLDHASQNESRGSIEGYDPESVAAFFGMETEEVDAILTALHDKELLKENRIVKWEKHQPKREREDDSTERVRRHRAEKAAGVTGQKDSNGGVSDDVTPCNATEHHVTLGNAIKTDRQTDREIERQTDKAEVYRRSILSFREKYQKKPMGAKSQMDFVGEILSAFPWWETKLQSDETERKPNRAFAWRLATVFNWLHGDGTPPCPWESPYPHSAEPPSPWGKCPLDHDGVPVPIGAGKTFRPVAGYPCIDGNYYDREWKPGMPPSCRNEERKRYIAQNAGGVH
jgi:hypothetical protein